MLDHGTQGADALLEKLNWRYATKKMDAARKVPAEVLDRLLEAANLAPTSSGLQPFEVLVVKNADLRARLRAAAYDQSQVTEASDLLVFAAWDNYTAERIDGVLARAAELRGGVSDAMKGYYEGLKASYLPRDPQVNFEHAARQAYIAFGLTLTAAAFEGVDATPMEGFDPAQVDEILGLKALGLRSVTLLPVGYRAAEGDWLVGLPKVRKARDLLVRTL